MSCHSHQLLQFPRSVPLKKCAHGKCLNQLLASPKLGEGASSWQPRCISKHLNKDVATLLDNKLKDNSSMP